MKSYSFDINKMIRWLMPAFLIRPNHLAWLESLLAPINNDYADFLTYKDQQLANATINSCVNRLTQALWDNYDSTNSIYLLQTTNYLDEPFIYLQSDGSTPEYDFLESDNFEPFDFDFLNQEYDSNVNFIVRIPQSLNNSYTIAAITAFVKRYVFSGISYSVEVF